MENAKEILCAICGAAGGAVAWALGGWDHYLISLLLLMGLDIFLAVLAAATFHTSKKTASGKVSSRAFAKGFAMKLATLAMLAVAHVIDYLLGVSYVRDAVAIGFCVNEVISICETWSLTGYHVPTVITKVLDILNQKAEEIGGDLK